MPFKAVTSPKCPKCGKSVYAAESRIVGELSFHKECFMCSMCAKALDSTNLNCHETILFCKTCYGRKYGPKGVGFGGGAGALSTDTGAHLEYGRDDTIKKYVAPKAAPGEGCPRCGRKVYAAEQMLAKDKMYHKTCFNCKSCNRALDSTLHCDAPDGEVYCKACYANRFGPKGVGFGVGGGTLSSGDPTAIPLMKPSGLDIIIQAGEGEDACPRCGGKVYSAESMLAKNRAFHKKCFKCVNCTRPLDSMTHCDGPDGEVYCKLCYAKKYGPKGYGFASGSGGVLTAENIPGGEELQPVKTGLASIDVAAIQAEEGKGCPRCGGKVFAAEEIFARSRSWHKRCYNCCYCHRPLDSVVGCDSPDGEVYCKLCYAKKYGPKGYGFASGGGGVMTAENINVEKMGDLPNAERVRIDVSKIQAESGKGCPRCGGKVFMAEEVHVRGRQWHRQCYNCCHCRRPLDSVVGCDAPDGDVYCKLCYAKKYGPKGYGFASGGGGVLTASNIPGGEDFESHNPAYVSINTAAIPAAPGEGCLRCGGKVFSAEEMLSRGKKWHKRCYNCLECRRPLDSMVMCDGSDGEIYCKLCYAKKFGPKGYGFASGCGGVMVAENPFGVEEDLTVRSPPPFNVVDPTKIPAKEGQACCPRCGGAVFQAESMFARKREWHKFCFNCVMCHRPLDSMVACDATDGEVYCTACYAKRHGPKGYGYGHSPALISLGTDDGTPVPSDIKQFGFTTGVHDAEKESRTTITRRIVERRVVEGSRNDEEHSSVPWGNTGGKLASEITFVKNTAALFSDEKERVQHENVMKRIHQMRKTIHSTKTETISSSSHITKNIVHDSRPNEDQLNDEEISEVDKEVEIANETSEDVNNIVPDSTPDEDQFHDEETSEVGEEKEFETVNDSSEDVNNIDYDLSQEIKEEKEIDVFESEDGEVISEEVISKEKEIIDCNENNSESVEYIPENKLKTSIDYEERIESDEFEE